MKMNEDVKTKLLKIQLRYEIAHASDDSLEKNESYLREKIKDGGSLPALKAYGYTLKLIEQEKALRNRQEVKHV